MVFSCLDEAYRGQNRGASFDVMNLLMTNLKTLSNFELVQETKQSVRQETQATMAVLDRLREINSRKLYAEMGYSALHEFCVVELGYSDGAAFRRIHALKLCDDMPEAKQAILEGSLSLTNAANLENYLSKDAPELEAEQKLELLSAVQGATKAECERILHPERTGKLVKFLADDETLDDLLRLSELWGIGTHDMAELIKKTAQVARKAADPVLKKTRSAKNKTQASPAKQPSEPDAVSQPGIAPRSTRIAAWHSTAARHSIAASFSREVRERPHSRAYFCADKAVRLDSRRMPVHLYQPHHQKALHQSVSIADRPYYPCRLQRLQ